MNREEESLDEIFPGSILWAVAGAVLGAIAGLTIVIFHATASVPVIGSLIQSKAVGVVSTICIVLTLLGVLSALMGDAGCVVTFIVFFLFGVPIVCLGAGIGVAVFQYVNGVVAGGLTGGVSAGAAALIVGRIRQAVV